MDKMQKLDEILKTYEEEMTETLRGLVRIPQRGRRAPAGQALWRGLRPRPGLRPEKGGELRL